MLTHNVTPKWIGMMASIHQEIYLYLCTNAFIDSDRSAIVLASIVVIDLSPMLDIAWVSV